MAAPEAPKPVNASIVGQPFGEIPTTSEARAEGFELQSEFEDGRAAAQDIAGRAARRALVDAQRQTSAEALRAEIAALDEASPRKLAKQIQLLQIERAQALSAAEGTDQSIAEINRSFDQREEAAKSEHYRNLGRARIQFEQDASEKALQAEIAATKEGSDERLRLELRLLDSKRQADAQRSVVFRSAG